MKMCDTSRHPSIHPMCLAALQQPHLSVHPMYLAPLQQRSQWRATVEIEPLWCRDDKIGRVEGKSVCISHFWIVFGAEDFVHSTRIGYNSMTSVPMNPHYWPKKCTLMTTNLQSLWRHEWILVHIQILVTVCIYKVFLLFSLNMKG